jgi:organic radical activating enzyme
MNEIKRFIECLDFTTLCNLKCSYCYVAQQNRRNRRIAKFQYSPEHIGKALSEKRLGGICYISLCALGETLITKEMPEIIHQLLLQGHYVNVTTNGTLSKRFDEVLNISKEKLSRLHFAFSLHYLELIRLKLLDDFFNNIEKVHKAGCSFLVQLNLCDEYLPYLKQIKKICEKKVGAAPQIALTRKYDGKDISLMTNKTLNEYKELGSEFESPLFDFTIKNYKVKRKEFCYAGDWSFNLFLNTGLMKKCYDSRSTQNIFRNIKRPIKFRAVGNNCRSPYCVNCTHFLSLGVIPSKEAPTYAYLRDRPEANWYTKNFKFFLNNKLIENNKEYNKTEKIIANIIEFLNNLIGIFFIFLRKNLSKIFHLLKKEK